MLTFSSTIVSIFARSFSNALIRSCNIDNVFWLDTIVQILIEMRNETTTSTTHVNIQTHTLKQGPYWPLSVSLLDRHNFLVPSPFMFGIILIRRPASSQSADVFTPKHRTKLSARFFLNYFSLIFVSNNQHITLKV